MIHARRALVFVAVASVLSLAAVQCGSSGESTFDGGASACTAVDPNACGRACESDDGCPAGMHCGSEKKCTAECAPGYPCPPDAVCSPRGRCELRGSGFPDGGAGDGGGGADACIDLTVDLTKVEPTIYLLIDQSSSMNTAFGDAGSRWNVVRDVLMNPDGGVVKRLEGDVSFGLALYTRVGSAPQPPATCPRLLQVAPMLANHAALSALYYDAGPTGGTPTGQSIDKLIGRVDGGIVDGGGFATLATPGPKIIVLATDGEPDSCEDNNDPQGRAMTVAATQAAYDAGVRSFVIAVGNQIGFNHLKDVANAGVGQPLDGGDAAPFTTSNRDEFGSTVNAIVFGARSCVFQLGGSVQPGSESSGTVTLDGAPLGYQDPNGWRLNSPTELEVLGSACQKVKTADGKLSVRFPCGAFVPR